MLAEEVAISIPMISGCVTALRLRGNDIGAEKHRDGCDMYLRKGVYPRARANDEASMKGSPSQTGVEVARQAFTELFASSTYDLALDSYQRPYVWTREKIDQLVNDLHEHQALADPSLDYYMGAILLHANHEKRRLFVIDGQQRLTALCILQHAITGGLPAHCDLSYRNPVSIRNIKETQERLKEGGDLASIFDRICFTVITVSSEDLAFTFFDTQNNRGVPLNATDLLKAYHLRAIKGLTGRLDLQKACAQRWERLQNTPSILGDSADFAPALFHHLLWRARRWTGQKLDSRQPRESHDELIGEFQTRSIPSQSPDTVCLYATVSNRRGTALTLLPNEGFHLTAAPIRLGGQAADLPFAIRQPISQGVGFFLYADKYADLSRQILNADHAHPQVRAFHAFHEAVLENSSPYLRELFLLASVMYVDQFGLDDLLRFALWLDHGLGAIRIEKRYVFAEAAVIFLRDEQMNLLDVIAGAFRPEEVVAYLQKSARHKADAIYDQENIEKRGVQLRYKQAVLRYYNQGETSSLKDKRAWITDEFINMKAGQA
jgi:hypothetical protein